MVAETATPAKADGGVCSDACATLGLGNVGAAVQGVWRAVAHTPFLGCAREGGCCALGVGRVSCCSLRFMEPCSGPAGGSSASQRSATHREVPRSSSLSPAIGWCSVSQQPECELAGWPAGRPLKAARQLLRRSTPGSQRAQKLSGSPLCTA